LHAGLLEGAHAGRGLGHEFLRHCQRARILVHVIDGSSPDPVGDYAAIQTELQLFAEDLASKPQACVTLLQLHVSAASDYVCQNGPGVVSACCTPAYGGLSGNLSLAWQQDCP